MTAACITAVGTVLAFLLAACASLIGFAVNRRMQLWEQESRVYAQVLHRTGVQKSLRQHQLKELGTEENPGVLRQPEEYYSPEHSWHGVEAQFSAYADPSVVAAYDATVATNEELVQKARDGNVAEVRETLKEIIKNDTELIKKIGAECTKLRKVRLFRR